MDGQTDDRAGQAPPGDAAEVPRLSPGDPLSRAAALLSPSLPLLPVVDGEGFLAGTVGEREVAAFLRDGSLCPDLGEEEALRRVSVGEAMDRRPVTALPEDPPEAAEALMETYALPAVAVTDGGGRFLRVLRRRHAPPIPPSGGSPRRP